MIKWQVCLSLNSSHLIQLGHAFIPDHSHILFYKMILGCWKSAMALRVFIFLGEVLFSVLQLSELLSILAVVAVLWLPLLFLLSYSNIR